MKQLLCVVIFVVAICVTITGQAMAVVPGYPLKWSQPVVQAYDSAGLPLTHNGKPVYNGWDEPSWSRNPVGVPPVAPQVADDWECRDNRPVTDFHWWGSYINWPDFVPPLSPAAFWFGIYSDVPAVGTGSYSHPGNLLWTYATTAYQQVHVGYDLYPLGTAPEACFQYNVFLPQANWFDQAKYSVPGQKNIFWLSIVAIYPNGTNFPWGWKTRPHYFQDDAVRAVATTPSGWSPIIANNESWDLSFELSTVPEPGTLLALASGLIGFVGLAMRKRQ
ncbi:MAG: PEP-CTERM sorting domain-containing protein [Armatimonadetes bacterium]|nr:PEP-CTERM sorting domain-containing protein [Armatimonadota bacterium]